MKFKLSLLFCFACTFIFAQGISKKTLFLGNSYMYVNDLPTMISNLAKSVGDTLVYNSNTIGGYRLNDHSKNSNSLSLIAQGTWDMVALQEQSQLPSFPIEDVEVEVFPYARFLDSMVHLSNPCTQTLFYMTWGRKNGDASNCASWPPVCTYKGMDSLLNLRYRIMANQNKAGISPVGQVWNYIRNTAPNIELYNADESHPSLAGTYAAACTFYAVIFKKDPTLLAFNPGLMASEAQTIRAATKLLVYDSLYNWNIGKFVPNSKFTYTKTGNRAVSFNNESEYASSYLWDFGDGNSSTEKNPNHVYTADGQYKVTLSALDCNLIDTSTISLSFIASDLKTQLKESIQIIAYPNPASNNLTVESNLKGKGYNFEIVDFMGKVQLKGTLIDNKQTIDLRTIKSGIYLLYFVDYLAQPIKLIKE